MIKPRLHVSLMDNPTAVNFGPPTKIDPRDKDMSIITVFVLDVAEADHVELLLASSTGGIDGEEDGEGDATTDEAHGGSNLEVAEEEVAVQRVVVEHIAIRYLEEGADPVEQSTRQGWRALPIRQLISSCRTTGTGSMSHVLFPQRAEIATRGIDAALGATQDEKQQEEGTGVESDGNEG